MANATILLVLMFCFASVSWVVAKPTQQLGDEGQWEAWKKINSKSYKDKYEEKYRKAIWMANLERIMEHNKAGHTFTLGMNQLGDLTSTEYRYFMLGAKYPGNSSRSGGSTFLPPSNVKLPVSVDWRTKGYVTPVKDQGQCGSCWAFSSTGSLEGQHFKKTGNLVSLSEQNLVDCCKTNSGCNGGWMNNSFMYIKANNGIDTEASYPYQAIQQPYCYFRREYVGATDTGFTSIAEGSEADLQIAVATVGPISVAIDAGHQSFHLYHGGVYYEPTCSSTLLDHAVLVVGYGTMDGQDYWLVKNSWAASWGMKGYIMMARNYNNQCGIATAASYPLV